MESEAHRDRRHRIQQLLERVLVGALFGYAVCAVISITALQTAYILALVAWASCLALQGDLRQVRVPLLLPFSAFALASVLATLLAVEPLEVRLVPSTTVFGLVTLMVWLML